MKIGDRIKEFYEDRTKSFLMRRMITIIRLDGKGFSKWTKGLNKPFDEGFTDDMIETAKYLCANIQGAKFAYAQSDEISVVLTDFDNMESQAWFDYNVQKMTSIAASMATAKFNQLRMVRMAKNNVDPMASLASSMFDQTMSVADIENFKVAMFDARVFQVPNVDEMVNTMIWRQQDASRNSVSMAASEYFSHKSLEGVSSNDKQERLFQEKGINWNDYQVKFKRGTVVRKVEATFVTKDDEPIDGKTRVIDTGRIYTRNVWEADVDTPIFTQNKEYLCNLLPQNEN
jgi:tRNA(His) 5'-end guanylyltransferase